MKSELKSDLSSRPFPSTSLRNTEGVSICQRGTGAFQWKALWKRTHTRHQRGSAGRSLGMNSDASEFFFQHARASNPKLPPRRARPPGSAPGSLSRKRFRSRQRRLCQCLSAVPAGIPRRLAGARRSSLALNSEAP